MPILFLLVLYASRLKYILPLLGRQRAECFASSLPTSWHGAEADSGRDATDWGNKARNGFLGGFQLGDAMVGGVEVEVFTANVNQTLNNYN